MNDTNLTRFDSFVAQFERRREWMPFVRNLRSTQVGHHPALGPLSNKLLEWAERQLGPSHEEILAEGYVSFVTDVNRSQLKYEISEKYQNSNYEDVYRRVYGNSEFMKYYHWGVYATTFAWPHHLQIFELFRDRFLFGNLQPDVRRVVDLGCGSGLWSLLAIDYLPHLKFDAIDISETSSRLAAEMARAIGHDGRIKVHCDNALTWGGDAETEQFDAGISCFVLEHLETPEKLLSNLARLLKPRAIAFVTAALTAAETDHIKEFRRESELIAMAEDSGFRVMETLSAAPPNYTPNGKYLPRSMAMILSKRLSGVW